jgi:hypothetical protein
VTGAEFGEVDIDLLADYIGGALTGTADESVVAARIADDPAWRAAFASLSEGMTLVGAELGRMEIEPMPADLAASLDAMFRGAEIPAGEVRSADESVGSSSTTGTDTSEPVTPHLTVVRDEDVAGDGAPGVPNKQITKRAGRRMRWAAPIAVAAGLVAFVGFGLDYLAGREAANTDSASDSSAAGSALSGEADREAPAGRSGAPMLNSGTDYTLGTLALEPIQPLNAPKDAPGSPLLESPRRAAGSDDAALSRLRLQDALQACLDAIQRDNAGGVIAVETVDFASFDGSPAVVVRFTAANGRWAWASGPACGTPGSGAATLGKVPVR